ncbi:cytochrome P450 71A1-like [Hibiscus syriacus]|uniref:cytochrome P450 71A1-like n=1 Tax=Hibiscus syriacus TaxID=106335 RepID=UPI0019250816|nr:cytochrome P450 71A1-like [Hibiscus syriacus]
MGFAPYGDYWRQVRKMSAVELFSHQRVHSFQFVRDEEIELLINKIRSTCGKGESINLSKMLVFVSSNIVSRSILSHRSEAEDGCSKFGELVKRLMVLFTGFCVGDMFPYLRWVDVLTGYIPSMKALFAELDGILNQVIQEHRAVESREKDFVSIIMKLQKDGGTDTSATATEWIMAELLKHPNAMKNVQQEVRNVVVGNKSKVDQDDIAKMEYLKCVVKETLRLHPPVVFVPRKTSASIKLEEIPNGGKTEKSSPERFENSSIDFQGQDFHYIPFDFGRRGCPGMSFGVASVEYVMASLLYWVDWKLPAGEIFENVDMTKLYGLTVCKKTHLHALAIPHSSF